MLAAFVPLVVSPFVTATVVIMVVVPVMPRVAFAGANATTFLRLFLSCREAPLGRVNGSRICAGALRFNAPGKRQRTRGGSFPPALLA